MIWSLLETLAIHKAHTFVVDEADMALDMGFLTTVDKIASSLPKKLQFLVFSATIPQKLQPFLKKYLSNPVMEQIKTKTVISDTIDNWLVSTKGAYKNEQVYQLTQALQPYLAMIFVNTKDRADDLHAFLVEKGLKVAKIHGGVPPRERKRIMNQSKTWILNISWQLTWQRVESILKGSVMSSTMPFHRTYPSLSTALAGLVGMVFLVQPSPSINRVMTQTFGSLKNWASSLSLRS